MAVNEKDLTAGFAFVDAKAVPARTGDNDRLREYREQQAAARLAAGQKVAAGLLKGKALTDGQVYVAGTEEQDGVEVAITGRMFAQRVASRAKALVDPALKERGLRGSITVAGSDEDGFRWFVSTKPLKVEEVAAE
jgi:hypothetical protein